MTEKLNIVQSTTEPDKRNIWLKDNELKKFGAKGWSTIGGSNTGGGGGTSTDKDALYIDIDYNNKVLTVNDKKFIINGNGDLTAVVNNKELYSILYNSLFNTGKPVFIKAYLDILYMFGQCAYYFGNNIVIITLYFNDSVIIIKVVNP